MLFRSFLGGLTWNAPAFPVFHNATAMPEPDPAKVMEIMQRQMTSSVLWIQALQTMWALGVRDFMEVGPKNVLTKLLKPNLSAMEEEWTGVSVGNLELAEAL